MEHANFRRRFGARAYAAAGFISAAVFAALAPACSDNNNPAPDAASQDANLRAAWVEIGDQNQAIARVITTYAGCPLIVVDGSSSRMSQRVGPATVPQRTTASAAADSKPSDFPVTVCEARLPSTAQKVTVASRTLPLPKASPQRIAIIADTGCRMKKSSNSFQSCSDPAQWPFARTAQAVAAMQPDLVLHIGDYQYRENACPDGTAGCAGSPWGYGWDTWDADLFTPAAPLLAAAPWVVVRGNHEECARAGQGWFRFLDTEAYDVERSCDDPVNDSFANYSYPYAVALGSDTQVIVFDSAKTGAAALKTTDAQFVTYQQQFMKVAALAAKSGVTTIFANHHPILGYAPVTGADPAPGNQALQSVMNSLNSTAYYPPGVQLAMHGHVHDFQALNFSTGQPATIVAGNGGDALDVNLPDPFPASDNVAAGATLESISHTSTYGFMIMERGAAAGSWTFKAYTVDGKLLTSCGFAAARLSCDKSGFIDPNS
ncbi:MAG TPA: metallophosphoesterase [Nevskia sp.]|nr:metallophosphoesterase [Nevskia sp.]